MGGQEYEKVTDEANYDWEGADDTSSEEYDTLKIMKINISGKTLQKKVWNENELVFSCE